MQFLQNRLLSQKFELTLRHSVSSYKSNKKQLQKHVIKKPSRKAQEDKEWEFRKSMNPFTTNVGMARQLKKLNIGSNDQVFKTEDVGELLEEMDDTVEAFRDKSLEFRKQMKADREEQRIRAKRAMIQKSVFPKKPEPSLLTWMEKEMIKYLHNQDSSEWTVTRLSESFPATEDVIRKVIKERMMLGSDKINKYNKEVASNWKMLTKNQLEISSDYENHLKSGYRNLAISSGLKHLAEQEIVVEMEKRNSPLPKPAIPGEFAKIIIDYNNKVSEDKQKQNLESQEVIDVPNLFAENSIPGTPYENEISPYTGTALLATNIDLRREKPMMMDTFRNKFLNSKEEEKRLLEDDPNPMRKKYLDWVRKQQQSNKLASKSVKKISSKEIAEFKIPESESPIRKYSVSSVGDEKLSVANSIYVFNPKSGYQNLQTKSADPDFIEIPPDVKYKYITFRMGDTVYDREGYFLYRLPSKTSVN